MDQAYGAVSEERLVELLADSSIPVAHRALWSLLWDGETRLVDALSVDVRDVDIEGLALIVEVPVRGRGPVRQPFSERSAGLLQELVGGRDAGPLMVGEGGAPLSVEQAARVARRQGRVNVHGFRRSGFLARMGAPAV